MSGNWGLKHAKNGGHYGSKVALGAACRTFSPSPEGELSTGSLHRFTTDLMQTLSDVDGTASIRQPAPFRRSIVNSFPATHTTPNTE